MNYEQVATVLENFIEGRGGDWDWDDYTSGMKFTDPYLRSIQTRMSLLPIEFPPTTMGQYCGLEGIEVIRKYVQELRTKEVLAGGPHLNQ